MKILRWCAKHKIWAFWIVAMVWLTIASYLLGSGGYERGERLVEVFFGYLIIIWAYSGIKRLIVKGKQ